MRVGIEGRVVVATCVLSMGRTNLQGINMMVWRSKERVVRPKHALLGQGQRARLRKFALPRWPFALLRVRNG